MTYKNLIEALQKLTEEQLESGVIVKIDQEFLPIGALIIVENSDQLDSGHPALIIKN